jgi:3-methyladenine DNA glycosylase AlkD
VPRRRTSAAETLAFLQSQANPANVLGMARYGIRGEGILGVNIPVLRRLARELKPNHDLAEELWASRVHEARILASMVDAPALVTDAQMEQWAIEFDSWGVCDQVCSNLFDRTPFARVKALRWSRRDETFVKRAGFVLMAVLAVHDKHLTDAAFRPFLSRIKAEAHDERNFVKKAVNWALRQIGKRNTRLHARALVLAQTLCRAKSSAARWVGHDALRELQSEKVKARLPKS